MIEVLRRNRSLEADVAQNLVDEVGFASRVPRDLSTERSAVRTTPCVATGTLELT